MKYRHRNRDRHRHRNCIHWHRLGMAGLVSVALFVPTYPAIANSPLNERTQQAMIAAMNDEYQARALYTAVIEKFGEVRPFRNIVRAEDRHVQRWHFLFTQYGLPIPEDTFAGNIEAPATLQAACEIGITAEIANVQMYDDFLEFVEEPDLRAAFTQLRDVSQNNHKPAFERCVNRISLL